MVSQEARDAAFGARLFFNGLMIFTLVLLLYYENDLQKAIFSFNFPYFISYFTIYGVSYYLFYTCGQSPGFLDAINHSEAQKIELSVSSVRQDGKESLIEPKHYNSLTLNDDLENRLRSSSDVERIDTTDNGLPELRYCEQCRIMQPYRTKHCDKCQRCVHKFDHHCFWIGGCVGELNHRTFWFFLLIQTILEAWTSILAISGQTASYLKKSEQLEASKNYTDSAYTSSEYGAFTIIIIVITPAFLFTGILLGFHTFLILTNQTTWEYYKKERITYLAVYPRGFYPFSKGLWENVKAVFLHKRRLKTWELPSKSHHSQKEVGFNWCENEYWECC